MSDNNKFCLKVIIFVKNRRRHVEGAWKGTADEAVRSLHEVLKAKGLKDEYVYQPILAEKCEPDVADAKDNKHYYKEFNHSNLDMLLAFYDIRRG